MVKRKPAVLNNLDKNFTKKLENIFCKKTNTKKNIKIKVTKKPKINIKSIPNPPLVSKNKSLSPKSPKSNTLIKECIENNKNNHNSEKLVNKYVDSILSLDTQKNKIINGISLDVYKKLNEYNIGLIQKEINKNDSSFNSSMTNNIIIYMLGLDSFTTFVVGGLFGYMLCLL